MQLCNNQLVAILAVCLMLFTTGAVAQFVTFKDGNVGVNFGGYQASAGLGGLLTGNSAHGGLNAFAGTPWGQRASAGLGGSVDGKASGVAYAGAQATPEVGASAGLGGSAGDAGYVGAEAHNNNKVKAKTITSGYANKPEPALVPPPTAEHEIKSNNDVVQKIKPERKKHHTLFKTKRQRVEYHDEVTHSAPPAAPVSPAVSASHYPPAANQHQNVVHRALNIPIGILRSLQESLSGIQVTGYKTVQKEYKL